VIELQPQNPQGYNALAWLLATAPDATPTAIAEGVTMAERAATLTQGRDASALDTLAATYAAAGDFARAVATAERALQVATTAGQTALAAQIQRRLGSYRGRTRVRPGSDRDQTGVGAGSDRGRTGVGPGSEQGQTGVRPGSGRGQTRVRAGSA
jgi:hypothetical protein